MSEREAPAPDGMDDRAARRDDTATDGPVGERSAAADSAVDSQPVETRSPEAFTETPGSHRRGPDGPALDVGG